MTVDYQRERDACNNSLLYSRTRRELAERRQERRKRLRLVLALPFFTGLFVAGYCAINGDPTGKLTFIALALMVPFVGTFDLLGDQR